MTWPLIDAGITQTGGVDTSTSLPTTVTGSGTAHTKGAWSELVGSTTHDAWGVVLLAADGPGTSATDTSMLVDLGIGGAGSEAVLVGDLAWGHAGNARSVLLPIHVPAGSRLSARLQGAVISDTLALSCITLGGGGWAPPLVGRQATTYGANAATSGGVALTFAGSANTKGAWTEIVASTTAAMRWMAVCVAGPAGDNNFTAGNGLVDIGVGGAGSEAAVLSNVPYQLTSAELVLGSFVSVSVNIPAGSRLSARFQVSAGNDPVNVVVVGFH